MREPDIVEAELVEISAMADDEMKLNSIIAWCATHPDEIPLAIHMLMGGKTAGGSSSTAG
jgi:predicted protein tyrosine phosphatase